MGHLFGGHGRSAEPVSGAGATSERRPIPVKSLMATSRFRRLSRASYTMPSAPYTLPDGFPDAMSPPSPFAQCPSDLGNAATGRYTVAGSPYRNLAAASSSAVASIERSNRSPDRVRRFDEGFTGRETTRGLV